MQIPKDGIYKDISSEDYHSLAGTYSSSQLKVMLEDPELFYRKYILKEVEKEENDAFDIGTYFHTAILEPHKLEKECVVYPSIRSGKKWDEFQETHKGKVIITESQASKAKALIDAVKNSPLSMKRIQRCDYEVTCFATLRISGNEVYAVEKNKILTKTGWQECKVPKKGIDIVVKVRADAICQDFILDLKSTSSNAKKSKDVLNSIVDLKYQLSAALYLDIFSLYMPRTIYEFVWTFASHKYSNCRSWVMPGKLLVIGRVMWRDAVLKLAECIETDWEFEESLGTVPVPKWLEDEYLTDDGADLL